MGNGSEQADRNIIYSFIRSALDDARDHLDMAGSMPNEAEAATDRCLRALDAIREAEEELLVSSDIVTTRKRNSFLREIDALWRRVWCATKDISSHSRMCYAEHQKSRVLRMHFLAYSYEPQDGAEAVGG
jgi:hypothetical protein